MGNSLTKFKAGDRVSVTNCPFYSGLYGTVLDTGLCFYNVQLDVEEERGFLLFSEDELIPLIEISPWKAVFDPELYEDILLLVKTAKFSGFANSPITKAAERVEKWLEERE
jgi:hypothetical protein